MQEKRGLILKAKNAMRKTGCKRVKRMREDELNNLARILYILIFKFTTSFTTIAEEAPPDKRQTISSLMGAFQIGGMILGSFLFSLAAIGLTWKMYAAFLVIFNFVIVALMQFVIREPPIWVERRKLMLQKEKEGVKTEIKEEISYKSLIKSTGIKLIPLIIIGISYSASSIITATGQFGAWYLRTVLKFGPGIMGLMGMVGPFFYILIRFISGHVSDRIGRLNTLILFNIIGLIFNQLMWRTHLFVGVGEILPVIAFYYVTNWMAYFQGWGVEDAGRLPLLENVPTSARATAENLKEAIKQILVSLELTAAGYMAVALAPEIAYATFPVIGSIIGLSAVFAAKKMGLESKGKRLA